MPELIALRAVFGQDEANHGMRRYRVGGDGLVRVPPRPLSYLISKGGFAVAKTTALQLRRAQPRRCGAEARLGRGCITTMPADAAMAGANIRAMRTATCSFRLRRLAELTAHGFVPPHAGSAVR